jgi:hypothetical protein
MTQRKLATIEHGSELVAWQRSAPASCPSCGSHDLQTCYEARRVPVHSCQLLGDSSEARSYPVGDIRLAYCRDCHFLSNLLFNRDLLDYSTDYEESQHHSSHFNEFARRLAKRWSDDYGISDADILEIGCGQGEFLAIFTEIADSRGIGIDPAYDASRSPVTAAPRLQFIDEHFSPSCSATEADIVCCRHTLEHIDSVAEFVHDLRGWIGERHDTLVLFELPDTTRILKERAFWDIYYEHCSYFTPRSLANLFRRNRFDVIDLRRDYGDQYLTLAARPTSEPTSPHLDIELHDNDLDADIESFVARCPSEVAYWQSRLNRYADTGKKIVLWGAGSKCVSFCTTLGLSEQLAYVVDINPRFNGKFLPGTGHAIVEPQHLRVDPPDVVIAMNPVYRREIQKDLNGLGIEAELLTL